MKNILLIIKREYLSRVKKKSFLVMTILGPLLMVAMYAVIIWAALSSGSQKKVLVNDQSNLMAGKFKNSPEYVFEYINKPLDQLKKQFQNAKKDALVHIPTDVLDNPSGVKIFAEKGVSLEFQSSIENKIEQEIENIKLTSAGITQSVLKDAKVNVKSETLSLSDGKEKKNSAAAASAIGGIAAFVIYLSVFIYGAQVMRSITEEKTSRIVEVIISSVKPFQLMIGKIVGVGLVGLTQFGLWIVLSFAVFTIGGKAVAPMLIEKQMAMQEAQLSQLPPEAREMAKAQISQSTSLSSALPAIGSALETMPVATILISFIFYFLGGYLLYSALFGAVGSAVDSDTDAQQFMLPITIPIIASFAISQFVIRDPNSGLAFWTSMVPFTSPIIMMVRIPFGVPIWQIVLSISLLIGGFIFTTWIASRIYRVGILMYGKKVSWKELGKWLMYRS
jgi:ABC-2 type transport system permease protein